MADRDYYDVLGVGRDADGGSIKKAYQRLAMKYHPDRNPGDAQAEQNFKEAAEAYEVLSDEQKRQVYDRYGKDGLRGQASGFQSNEDIFSAFGDIFGSGSIFEQFFGGSGGRGGGGARRGASLRVRLELGFTDPLEAATRTIAFKRYENCDSCKGTGAKAGTSAQTCSTCGGVGQVSMNQGFFAVRTTCPQCQGKGKVVLDPCKTCGGEGRERKEREVEIRVPAGVDDGMTLRVAGEGDYGEGGSGDLLVQIQVKPHSLFKRRDADVLVQLPIGFSQAALGDKVEVPTPRGKAMLKIPGGTQPYTLLRLRGEGFPYIDGGSGKGDMLVEVAIEVPSKLSSEQKELLQQFAETESKNLTGERKNFWDRVRGIFAS